jgi:seryl-tRNA synthetase
MILLDAVTPDTVKQALEGLFAIAITGFSGFIAKNHSRIKDDVQAAIQAWRDQRADELASLEQQVDRVENTMLNAIARQDAKIDEIGRINADTHDKVIKLTAAMESHDERAGETRKDIAAYRQEIQVQMNRFNERLDRHIEAN